MENANPAFYNAYESFVSSLSDEERALYSPCHSVDGLLATLQSLRVFASQSQKRRRTRILTSVKNLSDRLQCFFDVIGIFVQSNPDISALVWGSLRLVLQVSYPLPSIFLA